MKMDIPTIDPDELRQAEERAEAWRVAKAKAEQAAQAARAERLSEVIDSDWIAYFEREHGRLPTVGDALRMADTAEYNARRRVEDEARRVIFPEDFELAVAPRIITRDE